MDTTGEAHGYRGLRVWQKSMELALALYALSRRLPKAEQSFLVHELREASGAVPAHIAAGNAHPHRRDYLRHLSAAHGSLCRAETALIVAERLGFVDAEAMAASLELSAQVGRMLRGLMRALQPPQVTFLADPIPELPDAGEPVEEEPPG